MKYELISNAKGRVSNAFGSVSKVVKPGTDFARKILKPGVVGHGTNAQAAKGINRSGPKPSVGGYGKHTHSAGNGVYTVPMQAHQAPQTVGAYATNKGANYGRKPLGKKTGKALFYQPKAPPSGKYGTLEEAYQPKALGKPVHQQNVHYDSMDRLQRGNPAYREWQKKQRQASTPVTQMTPGDRSRRLRQLQRKRGMPVASAQSNNRFI